MFFFYISACYSSIKIILKIIIIEVSCITFTFMLLGISANKTIHDVRKNEFVFPNFE